MKIKNYFYLFIFLFLTTSIFAQENFRIEKDLLGEMKISNDHYYGVQAARAIDNFKLSLTKVADYRDFVKALGLVKLASARANYKLGGLKVDKDVMDAIEKACKDVMDGKYDDQFPIDMYQGGAGTSTNMAANEVIANVALEYLGKPKGDYHTVEPHDHINLSQSTNDFYPTAIKVAFILKNEKLLKQLESLIAAFDAKGTEFDNILKMGRTELQDAVPMTLGQEFHAFADQLRGEVTLLKQAEEYLYGVNMGGTAIGTKLNAVKGFPKECAAQLAELTGKDIHSAPNLIAATSDMQSFVVYSSALKSLATKLSKIADDLILMSSGPRTGIFEINLPAMQPGSSIMPGKVNPVIPEVTNLIMFRVIGNDVTVSFCAHRGQLQLNAYEPMIALAVMESQMLLTNGMKTLNEKCVSGITANEDVCKAYIEKSIGIVTALNPVLGYDKATELAAEALKTGKGILELVREQKLLSEDQIKEILDPKRMTGQE
jgi:aspartate ammonia-lyase